MKEFPLLAKFTMRPWMWVGLLVMALAAGFAIRMIDLTDLPLDFAPTRQLFSALKARGMYYQYVTDAPEWQRERAIALGGVGDFEPPILETLVAQTYRVTGEHIWIARIYSSLFWVLGGLALFLLVREMTSNGPALLGTLFYLFNPFGVQASRAFQPDPLMVALLIYYLWALFRWQNTRSWKWAILFGLFGGLAFFVKNVSIFFIAGALAGVVFGILGLKQAIRSLQVWVAGVLILIPSVIYSLFSSATSSALSGYFNMQFHPKMWIDPAFYFRWEYVINYITGFGTTLLAALSIFITDKKRERPMLAGLWIGYVLFGLVFSYATYTHYYYQEFFIALVAISIGPALELFFERFLQRSPGILPRLVLVGLVLGGLSVQSWYSRNTLMNSDYRPEEAFWAEIGDKLGHNANVVGLTQDYGYRLAYWGYQSSSAWFTSGDIEARYLAGIDVDLLAKFQEDTAGKQYFLVTMFGEFENQPQIKDLLYANYPVYAETDEYIIFDLQHPLSQP
jgi:4-amino-4-deoxy-L-arabinose transferase-like glycosyltransferase